MVPAAFDPPEHTRFRRILQPFFSPRSLAPIEPELRTFTSELIDGFIERGECDLAAELALPLPAQVFLFFFGLPLTDRDQLVSWTNTLLNRVELGGSGEPPPEAIQAGTELFEYLVRHIARRRQEPGGDDLLANLIADQSEDRLTDEELLGLSFQFVLAGLDTVTSALTTSFATLAARPDLQKVIVGDPAIIGAAVEEFLRFEGIAPIIPRVTTQQAELCGQIIPAGTAVQIALGAVGRDPAAHADPDSLDFSRTQAHIAFGAGPHRCLGSHLARMEMRMVFKEWHRRIPEYELAPGTQPRATWPSGTVGIDRLPLIFPRNPTGGER